MTLNEIIEEVYVLTNRRDLVALTLSAIKAATLKAHGTDFYSKDIFEVAVTFDTAEFKHSLDYTGLISTFRAIKYLRIVDKLTDEEGKFVAILTPEELIDSYNVPKKDVAYVAGRFLEIRSSTEFNAALFGCYTFPIVTVEGYSSWVAQFFPWAIIYEAATVVFGRIGNKEEAAAMRAQRNEEYSLLKLSALQDVGS